MIYVDFDGVILDTDELLFEKWHQIPNNKQLSEEEKIEYIKNSDWEYILENSQVINDAINILKKSSPTKYTILTKIHSLENEGTAKVKYLRKQGIKQDIILVPYTVKKADLVTAKGNILIDDYKVNIDDFIAAGGKAILFDKNYKNIDNKNKQNYQKTSRIDNLSIY